MRNRKIAKSNDRISDSSKGQTSVDLLEIISFSHKPSYCQYQRSKGNAGNDHDCDDAKLDRWASGDLCSTCGSDLRPEETFHMQRMSSARKMTSNQLLPAP